MGLSNPIPLSLTAECKKGKSIELAINICTDDVLQLERSWRGKDLDRRSMGDRNTHLISFVDPRQAFSPNAIIPPSYDNCALLVLLRTKLS